MEASQKFTPKATPPMARGLLAAQPDRTLCSLAVRGTPGAFDTIHARYHRRIFVYVHQLLGSRARVEDAEDLTQEIFQSAFRSLGTQRPDGSLKAWLFAIARNRTFDHLRVNQLTLVEIDEHTVAPQHDTEKIVLQKIELKWLMAAFTDLPERQREALVLRELGGLSYQEIASTLDTSEASVKQLLTRARTTIIAAAHESDVRPPRKLQKSLNMLFPVGAMAPTGGSIASLLGFGGGGAVVAASAGGGSVAVKIALGGAVAVGMLGAGGLAGVSVSGSTQSSSTPSADHVRSLETLSASPDKQQSEPPAQSNDRNSGGHSGRGDQRDAADENIAEPEHGSQGGTGHHSGGSDHGSGKSQPSADEPQGSDDAAEPYGPDVPGVDDSSGPDSPIDGGGSEPSSGSGNSTQDDQSGKTLDIHGDGGEPEPPPN